MIARTAGVALALVLLLGACEGPTGPEGPPGPGGPGTRIVLDGITDEFGDGLVSLPPEAGTLISPPAVTCYLSGDGAVWLIVALDTTDGNPDGDQPIFTSCLLGQGLSGDLVVAVFGAPADWFFRVVVVY